MPLRTPAFIGLLTLALSIAPRALAVPHPDLPDPDSTFNTFFVTWGNTDSPKLFDFLKQARPQVVQINFYGPMFHGFADNPGATAYPMQLPCVGQREALASQKRTIDRIHALGLKVVSHFQMVNVICDDHPERKAKDPQTTFVGFYEHRWPEDLLGPKPVADYRELLERDGNGNPTMQEHYVNYYSLCLNNPNTKKMLKSMLKLAIDQGVDGIVANYNYYRGCACPYCQASFKAYLGKHYTPQQLKDECGIADLASYHFDKIPATIPGYPDPAKATELDWAAQRWAAIRFKANFDEVLIDYGRKLKPDLIVGSWDHIGNTSVTEERAFTPIEQWGRGEDYFWYSGGYPPTDLKNRYCADAWLTCLYIRELSGGKPFMMGKYDSMRPRMDIAEGVATGGAGMGLQLPFMDPLGAKEGEDYLSFVNRNVALYRHAQPRCDVALVLPRQSVLAKHPEALDCFRTAGTDLVRKQVLFDVVADQKLSTRRLAQYAAVVLPRTECLSTDQLNMVEQYLREGGRILAIGPIATRDENGRKSEGSRRFAGHDAPATQPAQTPATEMVEKGQLLWLGQATEDHVAPALATLCGDHIGEIDAPWSLRAAAFNEPGHAILHLVNFNRDEAAAAKLKSPAVSGPEAELPIAAHDVKVNMVLHPGEKVNAVMLLSPDEQAPARLEFKAEGDHLRFTVPSVLVYDVVRIDLRKGG